MNIYTQQEIEGQPELWHLVLNLIQQRSEEINEYLQPILAKKELQIILAGAGSSAFIGEAAQGVIQKQTGRVTKAVATTDIVTHPENFLCPNHATLLVSFARSGNSPESLETLKLVNQFCAEAYHLVITCNKEGELAQFAMANPKTSFAFLLPEGANDKSLAMTGSFSSMLLSVLLIFSKNDVEEKKKEIASLVGKAQNILSKKKAFKEIATVEYERVVFLGSGPLLGIARECGLKLQELSDGVVICKHDSFLGFRHGPRAVANEKTLMVYLFSSNDHAYQYELDLAKSIACDERNIACVTIGREQEIELDPLLNIDLDFEKGKDLYIVTVALVGQLLGLYKSLELGLDPDNPSKSGAISRVVEGVVIYDHPNSTKA
ncbi:SIS domain-containing protein [Salinimicrobium tongyeongense]|uniref:SIS domain-containing protein n=1 Tax=Salinimicrobium tongyeongense TaxID=2809707 RepID=UPI0022359BF8|nr:SIS domain-containing protein [Salinimicrobium tongyeongense]